MRRATLALAVATLLAGPTVLAFFTGGYFDAARLAAAALAWLLVLVVAVVAPGPLPRTRSGVLAVAGLGLLAGWTAIATGWAPLYAPATQAVQRDLLYLGVLLAAAALLRTPAARRAVEPALAAGTVVVIGYALSERLLPGVIQFAHSGAALGRLEQPLTYWNAMGALAAIGAVLCTRIAGDPTRPAVMRAAGAAAVVPLAVGTWLSFSRGAQAALGVGAVVLLALAPTRAQLRALVLVAIASAPAVIVANAFDGVRALEGSRSAREGQGAGMLAILVVLMAAAAAATLLAARREQLGRWSAAGWRLPRWAPVAAIAAVVLAVAGVMGFAARDRGHAAKSGATAARLTSLESNRYDYWRVALRHGFEREPLRGIGPGGFQVEWLRHRNIPERARVAHSLYIETLAELGLVGFALLAVFLAGLGGAAWRARRVDPVLAAGPIAGLGVWLVHSAVDWDWEMPAVTLVALVLAGLLIATAEATRAPAPSQAAGARQPLPPEAVPA